MLSALAILLVYWNVEELIGSVLTENYINGLKHSLAGLLAWGTSLLQIPRAQTREGMDQGKWRGQNAAPREQYRVHGVQGKSHCGVLWGKGGFNEV